MTRNGKESSPLPHGYGSVHDLGMQDGVYRVKVRWRDGTANRGRTFTAATRQEAMDAAVDHLTQIHRQRRDGRYAAPSLLTVSDVVEDYLERSASRLTGRSIKTYRERYEVMILPYIGSRPARELTTLDVQQWIDRLGKVTYLDKGVRRRRFAPATINPAIAVLQGAYREATMLGIVPANVVQGVRRPRIPRRQIEVWTQEQARAALAEVRNDVIFDALYTVALATGMRPGELRALPWRNVDLDRGLIHVRATITRDDGASEQIVDRTKRGRGRTVAISAAVVAKLRWHKTRQAERRLQSADWQDHGLVFDRGDGHWLYQSHWQRYHRAMCEKAGVPAISHHSLRHTSASLELEAGTHPKIVSERLGHSSIEITLDLYQHVSDSLQRSAAESLSDRLFTYDNIMADTAEK